MNTDSLRNSLRCLVRPATILSIILLLLNDHLFKAVAPCWITGKVSDFAGLFFFPFLLAVVLSVFLAPLCQITPMIMGRMAFAITAGWFTAAKATPLGHALTVQFVSAIVGHEVWVILDPTDLIALVILWPAWRLWRREAVKADWGFPIRAGWLALVLATMATTATLIPARERVLRVVVADGEMYTLTDHAGAPEWWVYNTSDNGRTWSKVYPIPESLKRVYFPPEQVVVTDPHNSLICYRVSYRTPHKERVEYSEDGGSTWHTAWQVPAGRRHFMDLYDGKAWVAAWVSTIDMGPYDLAFTPDGSGTLVVAMGTEGVLVRDPPSGTWSRYAVGSARPTPLSTLNPGEALRLLAFPQGVALLSFVVGVSVLLSILGWVPILRAVKRVQGTHEIMWVMRPALVGLVVFVLVIAGGYILLSVAFPLPWSLRDAVTVLTLFVSLLAVPSGWVLLTTWSRAISVVSDKESADRSRTGCVWATVGLALAGGLPFVLWVVGIVPWYTMARVSAIVVGLGVVGVGATQVYRHSRAAVVQDEQRATVSNAR